MAPTYDPVQPEVLLDVVVVVVDVLVVATVSVLPTLQPPSKATTVTEVNVKGSLPKKGEIDLKSHAMICSLRTHCQIGFMGN